MYRLFPVGRLCLTIYTLYSYSCSWLRQRREKTCWVLKPTTEYSCDLLMAVWRWHRCKKAATKIKWFKIALIEHQHSPPTNSVHFKTQFRFISLSLFAFSFKFLRRQQWFSFRIGCVPLQLCCLLLWFKVKSKKIQPNNHHHQLCHRTINVSRILWVFFKLLLLKMKRVNFWTACVRMFANG